MDSSQVGVCRSAKQVDSRCPQLSNCHTTRAQLHPLELGPSWPTGQLVELLSRSRQVGHHQRLGLTQRASNSPEPLCRHSFIVRVPLAEFGQALAQSQQGSGCLQHAPRLTLLFLHADPVHRTIEAAGHRNRACTPVVGVGPAVSRGPAEGFPSPQITRIASQPVLASPLHAQFVACIEHRRARPQQHHGQRGSA